MSRSRHLPGRCRFAGQIVNRPSSLLNLNLNGLTRACAEFSTAVVSSDANLYVKLADRRVRRKHRRLRGRGLIDQDAVYRRGLVMNLGIRLWGEAGGGAVRGKTQVNQIGGGQLNTVLGDLRQNTSLVSGKRREDPWDSILLTANLLSGPDGLLSHRPSPSVHYLFYVGSTLFKQRCVGDQLAKSNFFNNPPSSRNVRTKWKSMPNFTVSCTV
jgi:hypothetical protein